ncbi:PREDICTED: uncharacterized protein LOC104597717 isoform X2 [Nelumbo nucifera]|uniref:V-type proton ATPase subunit S1/VOA1 transmembrane domain-containing protein n=2 Tax=Nelumbo nucifera TaxID=4432 RepID=A0A822ZE70_NELNU|nr:PREDICTED: uncharacterized protein LOC104597717 isoform X2 [Nelumbo nucifera]DAD42021.1 TPA_asm: hypothetical protein HUJ06_000251 [Nelumbo nucifera]
MHPLSAFIFQNSIQGKMKTLVEALLVFSLLGAQVALGSTSLSTSPAFLWFPHHYDSYYGIKEAINYRTISPKDLAKSVLSDGSWSNLLCLGKNLQQPVDIALVFIGKELQSSDISRNKIADSALLDLLKVSFTRSNFSMAFPYIVASEEEEPMEKSLISGFTESCGNDLRVSDITFLGSCSVDGGDFKKVADLPSLNDYVAFRMKNRPEGETDMIFFCNGGSQSLENLDHIPSEGEIFSELISSVEQSGAKYTVLYASDPYRSIRYPSYKVLERFLAEGAGGNGSANSTACDGVCQTISSLIEGVLVGIVLLIILISGLCCMMGIDTPTRFEAPPES